MVSTSEGLMMPEERTIEAYYKHAIASALGNLGRRGDQYLVGVDTNELVEYYFTTYKLPEIKMVDNGEPQVISEGPAHSHQKTDSARVTIRFNVETDGKVEQVLKLRTNQSSVDQNYFRIDADGFYIMDELSPATAKERINRHKEILQQLVNSKNREIRTRNEDLRTTLRSIIEERKSQLKAQEETITRLATVIPLKLQQKPSAPIVPLAKKREIRINPPQPKKLMQPRIEPKILNAIIDILVRGGKTFEAAPETFAKLDETDLRNILISFLNGNFRLHAVAEAFNKLGKSDISLRYSGDNLFVAECKFWGGNNVYVETIDQLFRYLTWRENLGVILCFVRERDFTSIIEKAKSATTSRGTYIADSLRNKFDSYFVTKHIFPDDKDKRVDIHHLLFTIYAMK